MSNNAFNAAIRNAGNRSRMLPDIPNIGQGPTNALAPGMQQGIQDAGPPAAASMSSPALSPMAAPASPLASQAAPAPASAPPVQPSTFTIHPPGAGADPHQYNYEPQADGSWRVYPPGVSAPGHTYQASLPRAASTGDYIRMSQAFQTMSQAPTQPQ